VAKWSPRRGGEGAVTHGEAYRRAGRSHATRGGRGIRRGLESPARIGKRSGAAGDEQRPQMNLAILSYEYPPETGFGGVGTYSWYHARALVRLGHKVRVIAGSTVDGIFESEHDGVRVTRIKQQGWLQRLVERAGEKRCWWFKNRLETAGAAHSALVRALERDSFDIVEYPECGGDGAVVSTLLPLPAAVRFHSPARLIMNIYDTRRLDRELTAFVEQIAINQARIRTSCSRFLADEVRAKMHVPPPIHVIPNGIDVELFDRDEGIDVYSRFDLPRDRPMVFFANRMEERKGIHLVREMAFHVLQKYRDVHMVFAGKDLFGYMERQVLPFVRAKGLQKRFHYLGALDLASVRAILKRIDVFLIPSLWENCPYSCIEAMTAGRAIVASDCGGMPELIRHRETGLLARNNDAASFIQALEEALEDRALRERLGAAARRHATANLTDLAVARRTVELYAGSLQAARAHA
jgi:glycosyltransferase involved in cell wall biosynthesis